MMPRFNENFDWQMKIDELVDGEMDAESRRDLFRQMDAQPDRWRQCAFAALETLALQQSIRELPWSSGRTELAAQAKGDSDLDRFRIDRKSMVPAPTPGAGRGERIGIQRRVQSGGNGVAPLSKEPGAAERQTTLSRRVGRPRWAAIHTLLALLILAVGLTIGRWNPGDSPGDTSKEDGAPRVLAQGGDTAADSPKPDVERSPDSADAVHLVAAGGDTLVKINDAIRNLGVTDGQLLALVQVSNEQGQQVVPVVHSRQLTEQLVRVPAAPLAHGFEQRMLKQGWKVTRQNQFVALQFPDGSHQLVPLDMLNYRFVGQEMF